MSDIEATAAELARTSPFAYKPVLDALRDADAAGMSREEARRVIIFGGPQMVRSVLMARRGPAAGKRLTEIAHEVVTEARARGESFSALSHASRHFDL